MVGELLIKGGEKMSYEEFQRELEEVLKKEKELKQSGLAKGKITKIVEGKLKDFLTEEVLEKYKMDGEKDAIKVYIELNDVGDVITEIFTLSKHQKAKIRKFSETYGNSPQIGQEVNLKFNRSKERWEIVI